MTMDSHIDYANKQIERLASEKEELRVLLQNMTDLFELAVDITESRNGTRHQLDRGAIARARVAIAAAQFKTPARSGDAAALASAQ